MLPPLPTVGRQRARPSPSPRRGAALRAAAPQPPRSWPRRQSRRWRSCRWGATGWASWRGRGPPSSSGRRRRQRRTRRGRWPARRARHSVASSAERRGVGRGRVSPVPHGRSLPASLRAPAACRRTCLGCSERMTSASLLAGPRSPVAARDREPGGARGGSEASQTSPHPPHTHQPTPTSLPPPPSRLGRGGGGPMKRPRGSPLRPTLPGDTITQHKASACR